MMCGRMAGALARLAWGQDTADGWIGDDVHLNAATQFS